MVLPVSVAMSENELSSTYAFSAIAARVIIMRCLLCSCCFIKKWASSSSNLNKINRKIQESHQINIHSIKCWEINELKILRKNYANGGKTIIVQFVQINWIGPTFQYNIKISFI